ncbi:MAG: recombinase family protein [Planctomycetota bacterium]
MQSCAIYARVSSDDQEPESQLRELRDYAQRRGWQVEAEYVDTISGVEDRRPQLEVLLKKARKRKLDVILVWAIDRLGRSLRHLVTTLDDLGSWGVDFVSYTQPFDTTTAAGRFVFQILGAVAEFEREMLRGRVKMGMARAKAQGKHVGRPHAEGIDLEAVRARLVAGESLRAVAKDLGVHHSTLSRRLAG